MTAEEFLVANGFEQSGDEWNLQISSPFVAFQVYAESHTGAAGGQLWGMDAYLLSLDGERILSNLTYTRRSGSPEELIAFVNRIVPALRTLAGESPWLPMATAPRNGTPIMAVMHGYRHQIWWEERMGGWFWAHGSIANEFGGWMPLPEVPA